MVKCCKCVVPQAMEKPFGVFGGNIPYTGCADRRVSDRVQMP